MTWLNWHTPSITPAEFAYCALALIVIEALIWIVRAARKEGKTLPEMHEHVDGSGK